MLNAMSYATNKTSSDAIIYARYLNELDIENGETLGMWKNNKLTNIDASCNIKKMYFKEEFGAKVIMLMDDGCLYTTSVHINIDL